MSPQRYKGVLEVAQTIVENHRRDHHWSHPKYDELERKLARHFGINNVKASGFQIMSFMIANI